jgi:hypothetical protein
MLGTAENFIFKALYIDFDENRLAAKSGIHDNIEGAESWSRKSAQGDKWSFCLTAGTLCPTNQERQ